MAARRRYRNRKRASRATAFVIKVGLLCCVLLVINAACCQLFCIFLRGVLPNTFQDLRVIQAIMFFGPILMIGFEFWIYDRRIDYLSRRSRQADTEAVVPTELPADSS